MAWFVYVVKLTVFSTRRIHNLYLENEPQEGIIGTDTRTICLTNKYIQCVCVCYCEDGVLTSPTCKVITFGIMGTLHCDELVVL